MSESYQIYVGNLPTDVSTRQLEDLFSTLGDIRDIWINPKYKAVTFAFIGFANEDTCNEACKRFDNYELNFFKLKVKRSFKKVAFVNEKSILLSLKKKTGELKSHTLKKILNKNLRQNRDIGETFKMAMQETEYLTDSNKCEIIKHSGEKCNLETLEETIIRNFKKPRQKKPIPVDIDLTKGKLLSLEQSNRLFNLQFTSTETTTRTTETTQQQQEQQTVRRTRRIPFELDYRSVCD